MTTPIASMLWACHPLVLAVLLCGLACGNATAQSYVNPPRIPPEDVLRPAADANLRRDLSPHSAPQRSEVAVKAQGQSEKLTWQLDDPPTHSNAVAGPRPTWSPTRRDHNVMPSAYVGVEPRRFPVRQAGADELAAPVVEMPAGSMNGLQPIETWTEGPPPEPQPFPGQSYEPQQISPVYPRINFQPKTEPKKQAGLATPNKCPTKEELMRPIGSLTVDIYPTKGDVPQECPLFADMCPQRCWSGTLYQWKASSLCHKPLYFEQVGLERYGHTCNPFLQPFVSGAHFFGTIPILPYKMGIEDPCECVYALGYCRPGDCAPRLCYQLPLSLRGAVYQAAAVTGVVYLLP